MLGIERVRPTGWRAGVALCAALAFGSLTAAPAQAGNERPVIQGCSDPLLDDFFASWQPKSWDVYADGRISRDYVPQGLAHDEGRGVFFVSYYDGRRGQAAPDGSTYAARPAVIAAFDDTEGYRGQWKVHPRNAEPADAHVGGLAVLDGWLVVSETADIVGPGDPDTDSDPHVFSYRVGGILSTRSGSMLPVRNNTLTRAASYATAAGGHLFLGDFANSRLYRYDALNADGAPYGAWKTFVTPDKTQGAVVGEDYFAFSRSEGRTRVSLLTTTPKEEIEPGESWHDPAVIDEWVTSNMSEGITWAPRRDGTPALFALFESSAFLYSGGYGSSISTCQTSRLWSLPRSVVDGG